MNVKLFTKEIYANWVRKKELERWVMMFVREIRTRDEYRDYIVYP